MFNRRSTGSIFIGNLDPRLKDHILNLEVSKELLDKFDNHEKRTNALNIFDLRELPNHTESEIYSIINALYQNSQFFIYCGPLLLNINPGPTRTYEYLNLQKWMEETKKVSDVHWKPHLYSFINYVYQTLCNEGKDQVVNLIGQIGSGKTFNLIHTIEYLSFIATSDDQRSEVFDMMHKSIQLIHIMGSIFRENNMESTCCALLLKLSFNENNKICGFDIESKIMDFTLPFSENGRSFSILHAIMCSNKDVKATLELPESENQLNFFKKFLKNFDAKTKEKFKLNDMEIWTRFHSLLGSFGFTKSEILEILQLLSFILLANESNIGRRKVGDHEEFFITKSSSSKKISRNLGITEEEFLAKIGVYRDINEIKTSLITLMKYSYFIVFEFIKTKVRKFNQKFFSLICQKDQNQKSTNLYFIDIPSEVQDQTLGGLTTNLANECLNLFAAGQYHSMVEKLEKEKLRLKFISPLHCIKVVESLIGENSLIRVLSEKFTEKNFYRFKINCETIDYLKKTLSFSEPAMSSPNKPDQFVFKFKFSQKSVVYNLESLHLEAKSLLFNKRLLSILELSKSKLVKTVLKSDSGSKLLSQKSFFEFIHSNILDVFQPLKDLTPFIIYCFHSNNSLRLFFGNRYDDSNDGKWDIPLNLTRDLCRDSLLIPILFWEWFGYHEWITVEAFVYSFGKDFEILKDRIIKKKGSKLKEINFKDLNHFEIATFILSILISERQYVIGANHIILRKGVLKDIRKILDNLQEIHKIGQTKRSSIGNSLNQRKTISVTARKSVVKQGLTNNQTSSSKVNVEKNKSNIRSNSIVYDNTKNEVPEIQNRRYIMNAERRKTLKVHCHYDIIDESKRRNFEFEIPKHSQPENYNLFRVLSNENQDSSKVNDNRSKTDLREENKEKDNKAFDEYIKKNNIIVASNMMDFNAFQKVLDVKNFEMFDYSENYEYVVKIQACFNGYKARKKYKIFRFVIWHLTLIQKHYRGWSTRRRFERYKHITYCVTKIQRAYKEHFQIKTSAIIKIQREFRRILIKRKGSRFKYANNKIQEELYQATLKEHDKKKGKLAKLNNILNTHSMTNEADRSKIAEQLLEVSILTRNKLDETNNGNTSNVDLEKLFRPKKRGTGEKKVEDKLIEYGEIVKKKKAEKKIEKLKEEENNLIFKPQLNKTKSNLDLTKVGGEKFLDRMSYFKSKQEEKLRELKDKKVDNSLVDCTYQPKITNMANKIGKRTINNLYEWNKKKEEKMNQKIKDKQLKENEELEEVSKRTVVNKHSEFIVQQKTNQKNQTTQGEVEEVDLWPVQMTKVYFEKENK